MDTVNPFIAVRSLENDHYTPFCFLFRNGISVKGFSSKRIALAIEPENILFAGASVHQFQPGNFTGWGSERVN